MNKNQHDNEGQSQKKQKFGIDGISDQETPLNFQFLDEIKPDSAAIVNYRLFPSDFYQTEFALAIYPSKAISQIVKYE